MGEKKNTQGTTGVDWPKWDWLTQIWLFLTVFTTPFLLLTIMVQHNNLKNPASSDIWARPIRLNAHDASADP